MSVSVAGKSELRLIATDSGNGNTDDHADWAGARVVPVGIVLGASPREAGLFTQVGGSVRRLLDLERDVLEDDALAAGALLG